MNYVYQFVNDNEVLYIGKSDRSNFRRIIEHGKKQDNIPKEANEQINHADVYIFFCANNIMSDVVESELIRRYKPRYNKAKQSEWSGFDFPELKWIPFRINGEEVYSKKQSNITNSEMGIVKHDYYKEYIECSKKVCELQYKLECANQTNQSLTENNERLVLQLNKAKDHSHGYKWGLEEWDKRHDLITEYNTVVDIANDLAEKYHKVLSENKKLREQQSSKKPASIWEKLFPKRKTA